MGNAKSAPLQSLQTGREAAAAAVVVGDDSASPLGARQNTTPHHHDRTKNNCTMGNVESTPLQSSQTRREAAVAAAVVGDDSASPLGASCLAYDEPREITNNKRKATQKISATASNSSMLLPPSTNIMTRSSRRQADEGATVTPCQTTNDQPARKRSKVSHLDRCICNQNNCPDLHRIFYNAGHDLSGYVEYTPSPSCQFDNAWHAIKKFLHPSEEDRKEIEDDGKRFCVGRHHYPLSLLELQNKTKERWVTPIDKETVQELKCYEHLNINTDKSILYDPNRGNKPHSDRWKKDHSGTLYIKAPCASENSVRIIAREVEQQYNRSEELQEKRLNNRTRQDWQAELEVKDGTISSQQNQINRLTEELEDCRRKIEKAKQKIKGQRSSSNLEDANFEAQINNAVESTRNLVMTLLADEGGLSRLTIYNDAWHAKKTNKDAAKLLWGFGEWKHTKRYVAAFFPGEVDVNYDPSKHVINDKHGTLKLPDLTPFEKCMMCRMFFRLFPRQDIIGLIVGRHRTRVGQILKEWAPKWANVGEDLSCLDITADYLKKETPYLHEERGRTDLVYVDGKDWSISSKTNSNTISKCTYGAKNETDSSRCLTYSTAGGINFEHTWMYGARAGECQLVDINGKKGPVNAPVAEWKDVAITDPWRPEDDVYWTALDDFLSAGEYDKLLAKINSKLKTVGVGAQDDAVLLTAQPTGLSQAGLNDAESSDESDNDANDEETSNDANAYKPSSSLTWFKNLMDMKNVDKEQTKSAASKTAPLITPEKLQEINRKIVDNDTNSSGKRKLCQLERLQRLHLLYEDGETHGLPRCLLSYFLLVTHDDRMKLLSYMGSKLASKFPKPSLNELPKIPLRLAKIPEDWGLGADKGFNGISGLLPNINEVLTPVQLSNYTTQSLSTAQIISEIPITTSRGGCETVFERISHEKILRERIPYWLLPWLPHGHALAHGMANLCQPIRKFGPYSIVNDDYWENRKDYSLIEQPVQEARDVCTSAKKICNVCRKVQEAIDVVKCSICGKWYHQSCHAVNNCDGSGAINPYLK